MKVSKPEQGPLNTALPSCPWPSLSVLCPAHLPLRKLPEAEGSPAGFQFPLGLADLLGQLASPEAPSPDSGRHTQETFLSPTNTDSWVSASGLGAP